MCRTNRKGRIEKDKLKKKQYYNAAFNEAEKYFTQHKHESALSNQSIRLDLVLLCNSILEPYTESVVQASNKSGGNGLALAMAIVANQKLHGTEETLAQKRIWMLYENAFGPQDKETQEAKKRYEQGQTTEKQINRLPDLLPQQSTDPVIISKMAQKIALIDYPLPQGYRYDKGATTANGASVKVVHDQNLQYILLSSLQLNKPTGRSEQSLLNQLLTPGRYDEGLEGKVLNVKTRGHINIAGRDVDYGLVSVAGNYGQQYDALITILLNGEHTKATTISGQQMHGPYNLQATQSFLKAIKKI